MRSGRGARLAFPLVLLAACVGCARKEPPSGGPPDLEPPRVVASHPDSGAASVPLDARMSITFSEGMEPRSTGESVAFAPPLEIRQRRWKGRTLELVLADSLEPDRTYTMFVAGTARDRHGNPYGTGATVVFSTAPVFPQGAIEGRIEARGFTAEGTYLWCYDAAHGRTPDSTARDFDALGLADEEGRFTVVGLHAPGRYRLWAFVDINHNRSLEPETDILAPADTTLELSAEAPRATNVLLHVVNPRAPASVAGAVLDSVPDSTGTLYVVATSESDTTKRVLAQPDHDGSFAIRLDPGGWTLRAFRDLDENRTWQRARERASDSFPLRAEPAARVTDVRLTLRPDPGGP